MGKIATKISIALGLIVAMIFGSAPVGAFAAVVRSTYIVQVQEGHANEVRAAISKLGETPHDELTEVMDGFVLDLTDAEAEALRLEPSVIQVVADAPMSLLDVQSPTPSWGLDRIDQNVTAGDSAYNFPASAGAGVRIYVVDTGVMATNPDFAGRILPGVDMLGQNLEAADCQGHGTHVAGTAAGTKYGVAKKALIVPVRVLSCSGSGSWSYFISAMDWIIANNPADTPAVMSASIGGGNYPLANAAVEKLFQAGITPVIAAGNSNVDACGTSPAGAPNAITVGASDVNDARASYSNWGECVDVFAPGSSIVSDSHLDPTGSRTLSGTSMATPHVSGLAALYLSGHQSASPAEVTSAIKVGGLSGAVANAQSTLGNILINNNFTRASVPVTPAPVYPPTGVTASAITSTSATISWIAPEVSSVSTAPESYLVEYKLTTAAAWLSMSATGTSASLSGLNALSNYVVRVSSVAGAEKSAPSAELQFNTLGLAPDSPTNLISPAQFGSQIDLSWTAPNSNGSAILYYYLEQRTAGVWARVAQPYGKSWSVTKLIPSTSYGFRIQAVNALGAGAYSAVLEVSTTVATPVTPSGIVMSNITGTTATSTWKASPQVELSVPITYVVKIYSRQLSNFGAVLATYTATTNEYLITGLRRTTSYSIGVTAVSGTAMSPSSALVVFTTIGTKASAPTSPKVTRTASGMEITWMSPADSGGVAITGYQVEKKNLDGSWAIVTNVVGTVYSYLAPQPARATTDYYRVAAINTFGVGDYLAINVSTPAALPTAPQSLSLTRGTTNAVLTWQPPADDGGAAVQYYAVQRSSNGGAWTTINQAITVLTFSVSLPPKGMSYAYRVAARNSSGTGAFSTEVTDSTATTAPGAVRSIAFKYNADNKLQITWVAPSDTGGSVITSYRLERQIADGSWSVLANANQLNFVIDRDLPGVLVPVRVIAINAVGESAAYSASYRTPYIQASAPGNFTAVDDGRSVKTTWTTPTELGGSIVDYYFVQFSRDNGATWLHATSTRASQFTVNVLRPTKGQTWAYRVIARTAFGLSLPSDSVTVAAALTVPSAPGMRSLSFAADGSMNLVWNLPTDNGGSPITGILVEKSTNNQIWTVLPVLEPTVAAINLPRELPGTRVYFRVKAQNDLGLSVASSVIVLQTPYVKSTPAQNLAATDNGRAVILTWLAPSNSGGSNVSQYIVEVSTDGGSTWRVATYVSGTALAAATARPVKGQTWSYRVIARTSAGNADPSNLVSVTAPLTATSALRITGITNLGNGNLRLSFNQPTDLGGYPEYGYRVDVLVSGSWKVLASGVGAATNTVTVAVPVRNVTHSYRLVATNPSGEVISYSFNYRG